MVNIEKVSYNGWPDCLKMSNGIIELIATTDVGPRIIYFGLKGQGNEFFEFADQAGRTGSGEFRLYGGHRLWLAPESKEVTYYPDNSTVISEVEDNTLRLVSETETTTKIQKELAVTLSPNSSRVNIIHKITNRSDETLKQTLAPWAISMMSPGGFGIVPQEPYFPHPDNPDYPGQKIDPKYYLPVRSMVMWSYSNLADSRLTFTPKYVILRQDKNISKSHKLGFSNTQRWTAYARNSHLFIKTFGYDPTADYPDNGCNSEVYAGNEFFEMESLGPLKKLSAGESATITENWLLVDNTKVEPSEESIDFNALSNISDGLFAD